MFFKREMPKRAEETATYTTQKDRIDNNVNTIMQSRMDMDVFIAFNRFHGNIHTNCTG